MVRLLLPLAAAVVASQCDTGSGHQPNIVIILADDFGWGDLSCYGGTIARTPHLDTMAREGVRFTQFYASAPICSPSRCGLITGQFPARWQITSFLQTKAGNRACEMADFLDPRAPTLPRVLKHAGYATLHVGKWHLGGGRDVTGAPRFSAYGYDRGLGTWESPEPHPDITAQNWIWSDQDKIKRWDRTRWMVDQTLGFLTANEARPCFVNLWLDDTHTPWVPSAADSGKSAPAHPELLRQVTEEMDRQLGRLLAPIRRSKANRPTLVIFMGDNGPLPAFQKARTAGLRGTKLSLYEGGVRVPFLVWGPGLVRGGVTNSETVVAATDLLPSLCKAAGVALPEGYEPDGEDLSPALLGTSAPLRSRPIYWEYGRNTTSFDYPKDPRDRSPNVAVREGNWKLLLNADGSRAELYDLATDPNEVTDQSAAQPARARELAEAALRWRRSLP
jgi:arylsulfatase A-like enzyme